jgi:S1-C subfamily serine protease
MRQAPVILAGLAYCLAIPTAAAAKDDRAPTVHYDPYTKTTNISGWQHDHNALLDLNKTSWWLDAAVVDGVPHNPGLIFEADMPNWAFLDAAADINGSPLRVVVLNRNLSNMLSGDVNEQVLVELPVEYARAARQTGLNIKLMGKNNSFVVQMTPQAVSVFMDTYEAQVAKVGTNSQPAPASNLGAPKIGIDFVSLPMGSLIVHVQPGSLAEKAGLKPGETVEAVNGTSIRGMASVDVIKLIAGSAAVNLRIVGTGDVKVR